VAAAALVVAVLAAQRRCRRTETRSLRSTFDDVQSYSLSSDGARIALRRYGTAGRRGTDVIVRELESGAELTFGNIAESSWSDDGALFAMLIDVEGKMGNGVQLLNAQSGAIRSLDASPSSTQGWSGARRVMIWS
jgi:hypothetical protein